MFRFLRCIISMAGGARLVQGLQSWAGGRRGLQKEAPSPANPPPQCQAPCQSSRFPGIAFDVGCELWHKCVFVLNGLSGLESVLHPRLTYYSALICPRVAGAVNRLCRLRGDHCEVVYGLALTMRGLLCQSVTPSVCPSTCWVLLRRPKDG